MRNIAVLLLLVCATVPAAAQNADPTIDDLLLPGRLPVPVVGPVAASPLPASPLAAPAPRTLRMWYHDSTSNLLLWRIPSSYGTFVTYSLGERFDLPVEKGQLDSIHVYIRELPLGKMRFDVWKDSLRKRVSKDTVLFHYPHYTAGAIDTAALKAGQNDTLNMVTVNFRSREVGKYFHIAGAPDKDSGITSLFSMYTDAAEGTLETITPENARAHMLWSIQNGPPLCVHMRGRFQDNQNRYLSPGLYMIAYVTIDGTAGRETLALPSSAILASAYPHPADASMTIPFTLEVAGPVRLDIYTALGAHVATVTDAHYPAGPHELVYHTARLAPGAYYLRLAAGGVQAVRSFRVAR
ncbi:MAG: hypothetical protein HY962_01760 [Ignavibacteriae bacterium]|nr:hypothetical protein [Ignavibacteriota bacterium]